MKRYLFLAIQLLTTLVYSQKNHVNEDFNNSTLPSGWSNNAVSGSQAWSFGIDGANLHSGNQNLDGTPMAFFDDDVLGQASNNNTAELITPSFNNAGDSITYLSFNYNFRELNFIPDSFYVDIFNGSQWQRVFSRWQDDCGNYVHPTCANSPSAFIDISAYADTNCQVRFTYHDGNDWGYYVGLDNVKIWSPIANDLSVAEIIAPETGCELSATDSIKVLIKNLGHLTQQNFDITFELNGNQAIVETVTDSIAYQDSLIYTFSNTGDFSNLGLHDLKVYTQLPNDSSLTNDTLSVQISNDTAYQLPYFDNFESINNAWKASGTNSSWAWGVPAGNVIDTAYSGQNAWVTNLNGNYYNNELSYLTSPCFDFSNEVGDPFINFQLNYYTETAFDRLWLEYSINFGQSWQKVPNSSLSNNWYNFKISWNNENVWTGNSNGWIKASNLLSNLAGEPQVKLRFVFKSDGGVQEEGIGIDNIAIIKRQNKDLAISEIIYPTNSTFCDLGNTERIALNLTNYGYDSIDTFQVFYQLDNLPIDSEVVISTIDTLSTYSHISMHAFDLSQQKNYTLKTWIKVVGDSNQYNDTLIHLFSNVTSYSSLSIPYSENFDGFTNGAANQNGWSTDPISQGTSSFGWRANSSNTPSTPTGPNFDHTSGYGKYIYLETSQAGSNGIFESPCINFNQPNGAILNFWYHRYGANMQPLNIDYYDGQNWVNIETITQKPQTSSNSPWTYHEVILPISGMNTKIRFRGSSIGCCVGDVAIDDVRIDPTHVQMNSLSETSFCDNRSKLPISLEIINKTLVDLGQDSLLLSYTINGQQTFYDTLHQSLNTGDTTYFTFSDSIDLTQYGEVISVDIMNSHIDSNLFWGDTVHFEFHQPFVNKNFTEDFEKYTIGDLNSTLWDFSDDWLLINDNINNSTPLNNHTFNGHQFLYNLNNDTHDVRLESICMNTNDADSLDLLFWYNIQGTASSKLYIYDHSDTAVVIIDSIVGSSPNGQWQRKRMNLNAYLDSSFALGFRFVDTNQNQSTTISLDDIQLLEQAAPYNLRTNEMEVSVNGCSYGNGNVFITVENIGLDSIPANAIKTYYQIDQNTAVQDSIAQAIAPGRTFTHQFSTAAALNQPGNTYNIKAWTSLNGDTQRSDDTLTTSITNQTKVDSLFEGFESFADDSCWVKSQENELLINGWSTTNHSWAVHNTVSCFDTIMNGPIADHTLGNGNYIYANNLANRRELELFTPCVDISQVAKPNLAYWVYTNLASTDTFKVEVNANGNWQLIDSIYGADSSGAWVNRSVDLTAYKTASPIQIRFTGIIDGFKLPVLLALDDISIADSLISSVPDLKKSAVNYKLYPNPSEGQFILDVDQSFIGELYQIRELSGKLVQEGKINSNKNRIQLNNKAKGIYFLSIPNKNVREKVVVY
ncbi:MAG: hypothetical protein CMC96_08070 [Flavobacteriales bacterium]|nr:hypothetical protein [Flavobacteriales bacterium]|tara:strand:- start:54643 stop:58875 length:4233 start_codon:yes stop_codon:yes gene_type:complete